MNPSVDENTTVRPSVVSDSEAGSKRDMIANGVLLALSALCVWRPAEIFASTPIVIAAAVLGLVVWAWRRTPADDNPWGLIVIALSLVWVSGLSGWDPASAVLEIALLTAVVILIWLASRAPPPRRWPALLALVISTLSLWALWQVGGGMERAAAEIASLPPGMQAAAEERLASGRAFASQLLPSHLAVLFATALPLLVAELRLRRSALPWFGGSVLCVVGLVLARSPVGTALALGACAVLALRRRRTVLLVVGALLVLVMVVVVAGRGDVRELEPVELRLDNWRTALWVWFGSPASGVGIGGFAQAAQAVPFDVGNRPRHAHSLPLEWLAEMGPVGLLACGLALLALCRVLRRLWPERPELAAALAVVPIHNLVDFSLYGSGVALAWAVLLGWGVAIARPPGEAEIVPARWRVLSVVAAAAWLAAVCLHATSSVVEETTAARTSPIERADGALTAYRLAPWRIDSLGLLAAAALESRQPAYIERALDVLQDARWLRPRSAALAALRARLALAVDRAPTAAAEAWLASAEQPLNDQHRTKFEDLLRLLDPGGDDGAP